MSSKKTKIKWIVFKEFGLNAKPYFFELIKEEIIEDEIFLCITEQIYEPMLDRIDFWATKKVKLHRVLPYGVSLVLLE